MGKKSLVSETLAPKAVAPQQDRRQAGRAVGPVVPDSSQETGQLPANLTSEPLGLDQPEASAVVRRQDRPDDGERADFLREPCSIENEGRTVGFLLILPSAAVAERFSRRW